MGKINGPYNVEPCGRGFAVVGCTGLVMLTVEDERAARQEADTYNLIFAIGVAEGKFQERWKP